MKTITLCVLILLLTGCASSRPLRPGTSTISSSAPATGAQFSSSLKQPENPAQAAAQNFERTTETELPLPAGSRVREVVTTPVPDQPSAPPIVREQTIVLSQAAVQKTRTIEKAGTTVGAAQKDTAREIGAKLSSLKGVVWVGVGMILFGIASFAYPPLRLLIGSVTTSAAILAGGFALVVLPSLVAGNELLILGGVALTVGLWFLAHRHGNLRAKARTP